MERISISFFDKIQYKYYVKKLSSLNYFLGACHQTKHYVNTVPVPPDILGVVLSLESPNIVNDYDFGETTGHNNLRWFI